MGGNVSSWVYGNDWSVIPYQVFDRCSRWVGVWARFAHVEKLRRLWITVNSRSMHEMHRTHLCYRLQHSLSHMLATKCIDASIT